MTSQRNAPAHVFPRSLTWIGITILGSALTSIAMPHAVAQGPALHSSTVEWSGADLPNGVISGGAPASYTSGIYGWGAAPFSSLGPMGLEWETPFELARRELYMGSESNVALVPGGISGWTSNGLLFPRPTDSVDTTSTISIDANQARWSVRLYAVKEGTMSPFRFFWIAGLVDSYESVFSSPSPGVVVISDASQKHPTLVLRATATSGVVQWGGSGIYSAPLGAGEKQPTLYVHSTGAQDITVTITLGVVDSDPCESAGAINFATANAATAATPWPTLTSCMGSPSWVAQAGESAVLEIPLAAALDDLGADHSRELSIDGLPAGVTWERLGDTPSGLSVRLDSDGTVTPGAYSLSFSALTATTTGGVTRRSQPLSSLGALEITAPAEIAPPPEPELAQEPVVDEPTSESTLEPTSIQPDDARGQATSAEPDSPPTAQVVAEAPRARLSAPAPVLPESPAEPFAIARPQELPLFIKPPVTPLYGNTEEPPEPTVAGSWVGLSLLVSLALGAFIAAIRRRKEPAEE